MREGLAQALQMSPTALRKAIRRKRLVRRTADPTIYKVKATLGSYHHVIRIVGPGEAECLSFDCEAGAHGWLCWAGRATIKPSRVAREVRRYRYLAVARN
jgi:hypothetical protein